MKLNIDRVAKMIIHPNQTESELVVFCGAGISNNSNIPLAKDIEKKISKSINMSEADILKITDKRSVPFEGFIERIIEGCKHSTNENKARSILFDVYRGVPNDTHKLLALLCKKKIVRTIVTTNFDKLIEQALDDLGVDYKVFIKEEDFSNIDYKGITVNVIKIHGSIEKTESLRTTLRGILNDLNSDKRREVIENIFSCEKNNRILVLGHSCSDLDLVPFIKAASNPTTEIICIAHSKSTLMDIEEIDEKSYEIDHYKKIIDTYIKYTNNHIIRCNTDILIAKLIQNLGSVSSYKRVQDSQNLDLLSEWGKKAGLNENGADYLLAGNLLSGLIDDDETALEYFFKAFDLCQNKDEKSRDIRINCLMNISTSYRKLHKYSRAKKYIKKAKKILKKHTILMDLSVGMSIMAIF